MNGECDKCGEHALECKCRKKLAILTEDPRVKLTEPISVSINKQYFTEKFLEVFEKWDQKLCYGIDKEEQKNLMDDLINTMR